MLRITIHDQGGKRRMQLEGKLAGAWVKEADDAWRCATTAGSALEIDLTGITWVDCAGEQLIAQMKHSGARFIARGVVIKALVATAILTLLFSFTPSLRAQEPAPVRLTLKDAVTLALKQNPQVAIANLNLAESQEDRNVARSALLPQVGLNASDRVTRGNIEALFGKKIPGFPQHNGPFWAIQAGPGFSAPVFDLTLWRRWQESRENVRTSAAQETSARELNAQLVVSQYLGSLRAAADVSAAKSRLDLAKALLDLATDLQRNGAGTGIDTLRANVQYQNETQRYSEASAQLKVALYGLNRLLNLNPEQTVELADEPSFFETPAFDADGSLNRAYAERPELKAVASQIRAAALEKRAARDERLPKISVSGGWSLEGLTPTSMIPTYQYGASLNVPLFTGGRIQAETAIADIELKKLAQNQQEIRNQVALEVKTALAQLEAARVQVDAANLGINLARETVTQAQDRFRAGVANNIEVITAQDDLARANDNQITALYRYNQSRADLARATGQMETLYTK
jgi:outer membrane protein TolC